MPKVTMTAGVSSFGLAVPQRAKPRHGAAAGRILHRDLPPRRQRRRRLGRGARRWLARARTRGLLLRAAHARYAEAEGRSFACRRFRCRRGRRTGSRCRCEPAQRQRRHQAAVAWCTCTRRSSPAGWACATRAVTECRWSTRITRSSKPTRTMSPSNANATRFAASQLTRTFANLADAVIVPTRRWQRVCASSASPCASSRAQRHRPRALRRRPARRSFCGASRAREGDRLLLCVCRLAKEKNVELLFEALRSRRTIRAEVASPATGRCAPSSRRAARECWASHERTRFLGDVPRDGCPISTPAPTPS